MSDVADIVSPPPPARRAPSAPQHSNSPSLDSSTHSTLITSQPFKPPHLRLDSNGSSASASSSPLTQASLSPHNTALTSSPRHSPLGRRSNIRLASPRTSILSPSHSLPSLHNIAADDVLHAPLNRSSSNNRLSAIVSKKAGLSPIVTASTIAPAAAAVVSVEDVNAAAAAGGSMPNVEEKPAVNGTSPAITSAAAALAAAAGSIITSSPALRPSPLDRPSSISLQLPQQKGLLPADSNTAANGTSAAHPTDNDAEEEAAVLTINHSVGAGQDSRFLQQPLQPLSSASSQSSASPAQHYDPTTPITPYTPNSSTLPPTTPTPNNHTHTHTDTAVNAAYKDQLDGVLRRRGDSHLNLQSLDPTTGQLTVPLPLQMRQMSAMGADRRVAFRVDIIPEGHEEAADTRLVKQWNAGMRATRGILKTVNIKGTEEERRRRVARATEREKEWIRFVQEGSTLIKYNAQGKPQKRWVYVSDDGHEINWEKPTDQWLRPKKRWDEEEDEKDPHNHNSKHGKHTPPHPHSKPTTSRSAGDIHATNNSHTALTLKAPSPRPVHQHSAPAIHRTDTATTSTTHSTHSTTATTTATTTESTTPNSTQSARSKRRSSLPSMRILNWKINPDRTRYLADVLGVHYGPYHSADRFGRFLQRKDYQTGFPWLAFTIEFPDRTLDLVGAREDEVQQWFLGVQALAPLSVHHLTMGGVLWQRLIMKLNFYGLVNNTSPSHTSSTRRLCAVSQEPIRTERISSWTSSDDGHWGY